MMRLSLLGLLTAACLSTALQAQDNWSRFRGPNANGVAKDDARLPTTWDTPDNVRWVAEVPGLGWSSPIVWGDKVFLTTVVSEEENEAPKKGLYLGQGVKTPAKGVHHWLVYCFDLKTGKQLWKREAHKGKPVVPRHPKNTYAAETATTDGERLYVLFGDLGLYCYDLDGKPLWSQKIEPKKTLSNFGAAASPVVHDGQVVIIYDNQESSFIASFDAATGKHRWRQKRDETSTWATPFIWKNKHRTEIIACGRVKNRSYDLSGKLLWEFDGRMSGLVIPSPFVSHGMLYITSGYVGDQHRPVFAIKPGASGDISLKKGATSNEFIKWYQPKAGPYNPSPIVYGDYYYTLYDRGFLTCHNALTGEEVYGKKRFAPGASFTSSPWAYNGKLFFLSEDGDTYVVKAGPEYKLLATNVLDELCLSSPAVSQGNLLIRTASKLYCLSEGAKLDAATAARLQPRKKASKAIDIWAAAAKGNRDVVLRLLAAGTSVNAKQRDSGATPLNTAALFGQTEIAKLLVEKGADVSLANKDGNTALHIAAFFAHEELVQLLLRKGTAVHVKNAKGETPIDVAAADWSPQLEGIYKYIGDLVGVELDLERIKKTRPRVAKLLRDSAAVRSAKAAPSRGAKGDKRNLPPITPADWSSYNHDVRGWRFNSGEKTLTANNASELEEKWRFPAKGSKDRVGVIHATPTVVNGYVYFGTATYPAFYKLKPDGTLAWVYRLKTGQASSKPLPQGGINLIDAENGILTSALVTDTSVYFGNSAGVFYALDRITGKELWKVNTRAKGFPDHHLANVFLASAILVDGKVIVGGGAHEHPHPLDPKYPCCTGRGFVVALDPSNGKVVWKYDVGEKPKKFDEPVVIEDPNGKHVFKYGPSTSSVWSTPSYEADSGTIFFGTDVHNSPRKPTKENPRYDTKYSAAVIAVDIKTGREKWVTQLNEGDIFNHSMSGYDPKTGRYKDCSIGDTPKVYSIEVDDQTVKVVGVGCKNGGFYVLRAGDGKILAKTPVFEGKPKYPLDPKPDPRMIALPSPIGGIQTGCATDGKNVFTNGMDWLSLNTKKPAAPEGGRVASLSGSLGRENWRHERPKIRLPIYTGGDPVAAGVALGGGIVCFTPAISEQLVVLDAASGKKLKEIHIGAVWSGPSISRGRIYVGTGSILFLKKQMTGTLYSFGLPGDDEVARMGAGSE